MLPVRDVFKKAKRSLHAQGEDGDVKQGTPGDAFTPALTHFRRDAFPPRLDWAVGEGGG